MDAPKLDKEYIDLELLDKFPYGQLLRLNDALMHAQGTIYEALGTATELELMANESKLRGELHFIEANLLMVETAMSAKEEWTTETFEGEKYDALIYLN